MTYTVYVNQNGKAVAAGKVTANTLEEAKASVMAASGIEEKDFMLIKEKHERKTFLRLAT